ncbi:signal transduction histidine kinase [Pedobacter sp. UYP24]
MEAISNNVIIIFKLDPLKRMLIIEDNGIGISAALSEQLFSPFFSTKKDGQGIGLTLVREILLNHGFDFSLKATESGTTAFSIKV